MDALIPLDCGLGLAALLTGWMVCRTAAELRQAFSRVLVVTAVYAVLVTGLFVAGFLTGDAYTLFGAVFWGSIAAGIHVVVVGVLLFSIYWIRWSALNHHQDV
jgi:hypothetical protein